MLNEKLWELIRYIFNWIAMYRENKYKNSAFAKEKFIYKGINNWKWIQNNLVWYDQIFFWQTIKLNWVTKIFLEKKKTLNGLTTLTDSILQICYSFPKEKHFNKVFITLFLLISNFRKVVRIVHRTFVKPFLQMQPFKKTPPHLIYSLFHLSLF